MVQNNYKQIRAWQMQKKTPKHFMIIFRQLLVLFTARGFASLSIWVQISGFLSYVIPGELMLHSGSCLDHVTR